jgi:hypothetical protein
MPMVYAAVALAVAIGLVLGAWTLGYQRGEAQTLADQQILETAINPGSQVSEPGTQPASGTNRPSQPQQPEGDRGNGSGAGTPSIGVASFLTTKGPSQTDPRQDRHNYLQLGSSIRVAEMQSIIDLMASRNLGCFGVIESGSQRRNDGPLYVLFASRGFPSGEANSQEARRYREQVLAAGRAWKQAGGVKDFDDAVWALHKK